ncbi:hypothetical protein [Nocardiopsis dassonvillei]|uniref:hypothetical protein n=1 Tax=Nocardiopsis dassonvillei TaxID=2014 RepID=UPI00366AC1FB
MPVARVGDLQSHGGGERQDRHPHLVIWFGESTQSYWVASSSGLGEAPDAGTLERLLTPGPTRR